LVLMDCRMPEMDGYEATRQIRQHEGSARHTKIVAMTAHALAEVRDRCLQAGMDDFLVKPFDEEQMLDMLGRWLTPREGATTSHSTAMPARSNVAAAKTIDMAAIDKIRMISGARGGSSLLRRVVAQFGTTSPPLAVTIREKATDGDTEAVWRAAHSLKSSAAAVGASIVAARCAQIETTTREDRVLPSNAVLTGLDDELVAAVRDLQALVDSDAAIPTAIHTGLIGTR